MHCDRKQKERAKEPEILPKDVQIAGVQGMELVNTSNTESTKVEMVKASSLVSGRIHLSVGEEECQAREAVVGSQIGPGSNAELVSACCETFSITKT
jgi:hypothetical protein